MVRSIEIDGWEEGMADVERVSPIVEQDPRREWLLRCESDGDTAVCSIGVAAGAIEVYGPDQHECFSLTSGWEIAAFRRAFNEAVAVAEADMTRR
jgi:hypothetical protein